MKFKLILLSLLLTIITGCLQGVAIRPEAVAYKTGPIAYEDDIGVIVRNDDGTYGMVVFPTPENPNPTSMQQQKFFQAIMRDHVIDEGEAKALNKLLIGAAGDIITTQIGLRKGCVESNPIFRNGKIMPMIVAKSWAVGIAVYGAKQSTIYESMVNHDKRYINVLAGTQWYLTAKNTYTIFSGC